MIIEKRGKFEVIIGQLSPEEHDLLDSKLHEPIPPELYTDVVVNMRRSSGDSICEMCNLPHRKHPRLHPWRFLNLLCDETVVKL